MYDPQFVTFHAHEAGTPTPECDTCNYASSSRDLGGTTWITELIHQPGCPTLAEVIT